MKKILFLDRDGVINLDKGYVHRWEDFEFIPGSLDAMRSFCGAGYEIVVVTNQAGIARGMYTEHQYNKLTNKMVEYLSSAGVELLSVYHCPHHPDGVISDLAVSCTCRKPQPGMLLQARAKYDIDMKSSILVGDKSSDIQAARMASVGQVFLVRSAYIEEASCLCCADAVFDDLASCAAWILSGLRG